MRLDANGYALISREEGLRTFPYNDSAGHATIGVGHLIHRGAVTAADRARFRGFTRADAIHLLAHDASSREAAVSKLVTRSLNQNEFNALVSLVFNIGEGAFRGSTVLRKLNAGDRRGAAQAFLMWRVGGAGLIFRRRREMALFLKPVHKPDPYRYLTDGERALAKEYDRLKRAQENVQRRRELREAMTVQRKRIWRAAKADPHGYDAGMRKAHRAERYKALMDRTS